ncbi:Mad3/BUB1 homology region 1-domain-containing protein [Roridomyces roridus]|uniref:Mad3/BUB1 homology region 1-domain-containing protein n=1 Tax=Roridomyces roridus TaxID=1738132 RepID=A0AAD7CJ29_9AGAR|nr:Mad3/BUB1 homology region 1-domain-containing protein [Roridomyces roridus]
MSHKLAAERARLQAGLLTAKEDDDPLAAYDYFIKWTVSNYPDNDPDSGLRELLHEATGAFRNDPLYKTDLRYLKLWLLYIRQLGRTEGITEFAFLLANGIGASYSVLYEEYANVLELEGRNIEAEAIYTRGIKRQVRPLERLKSRYREFKTRLGSKKDPERTPTQRSPEPQPPTASSSSSLQVSNAALAASAEARYAHIFAPAQPGKRPEKHQFDLSLLFNDGKEYCIEEARARSIGLYGKKWPAPPPPAPFPSEAQLSSSGVSSSSSSSSLRVNFNDDGQSTSKMGGRRRSMLGVPEPTVTINTKEALADVFGMFNSPEKTAKLAAIVVKKIEPSTPMAPPSVRKLVNENENAYAKTPQSSFRPFVDENASVSKKENTPAKFVPFTDPEVFKTPSFTAPRGVLAQKETPTPGGNVRPNPKSTLNKLSVVPEDENPPPPALERNVFKVFTVPEDPAPKPTPLPMRDVFTDDLGKPQPRPTHERAKSYHDSVTPAAPAFTPFVDENRTPFKVFSRPPDSSAVTPSSNAVFTPFRDPPKPTPTFTPFQDPEPKELKVPSPPPRTPSWSNSVVEIPDDEEEIEQYQDDYQYDDDDDAGVGEHLPPEEEQEMYEEAEDESYQVPLGGRFGQFTVMTPITERTFEYTSTTTRSSVFGGTPSRVLGQVDEGDDTGGSAASWRDARYAANMADRLAAELRDESEEEEEEPVPPQSTDVLRLVDTLKASTSFKPPNPCNPFDRDVMASLLSCNIPDQYSYDYRDRDANLLDSLQRFAKRARKTSGNTSNTTGVLEGSWFPLNLDGHRFNVSEKLGEGGFGAVFKARDMGTQEQEGDTDDEEDEDEDGSSMVAVKVVKPRNLWEYRPNAASLSQAGGTLDELLVMFFAVELLRLVEGMHRTGFIHGDLKIDNCLLRLEDVPGGTAAWSSMYSPAGDNGWSHKGLKLIDFGRTIDTHERDCFELRENRPWTYQTDYFGLAGIIYCMLFGKYMQANSVSTRDGRHRIDTTFKRYWQTEIWDKLFGILLNPCAVRDGELPLCDDLAQVRVQMESWLQANCNRASNTLKGLLKKVEVLCI